MVISNLNKTFDDNQNETNEDYKQDQELLVLLMKKIEQLEAKYDALEQKKNDIIKQLDNKYDNHLKILENKLDNLKLKIEEKEKLIKYF